jgi:O-antigen ligase
MKREAWDDWCERVILGLVLGILVFAPLALGAVGGLTFAVVEGLTVGVLVLWGARLWLNPRLQFLWPPVCWAVLGFAVYAVGRYFTADIEYIARQELLRVLVYAFLFFAILNNLHRQESMQIISLTLIVLAMTIAAYAVFQFLTDSDYVWWFLTQYPHRGSGTYICPNHTAGLLEMLVPLALALALAGRLKPVSRVLVGYAALVIVAGIGVTVSRGGWAATGVALLLLVSILMFHRSYRWPAVVLLVLLVGAGCYFVPRSFFLQLRLKQLAAEQEQGKLRQDVRVVIWEPAFRMWKDHPWWGVGPGHFDPRFRQYRPESIQASPYKAHNDYLNTLADWGLAGGLLITAVLALLTLGVARTWRVVRLTGELGGKSSSNKFAVVLGGSLGLAAILVHSQVDYNLQIPANALVAVTLAALLSSHLRFVSERFWFRAEPWAKVVASLVLVAGAGLLAQQSCQGALEGLWLNRAADAPVFSHAKAEYLTRAFAIESANPETAFAIGEALQRQSREGGSFYQGQEEGVDYRTLAQQAMTWFERGMKLNPWDNRNFAGYGWCLDWLERSGESTPYFERAEALDPNNYFNLNAIGLHYVQVGDYAAARPWFERSLHLEWFDNPIARSYLDIANARLREAATNELSAKLHFSTN